MGEKIWTFLAHILEWVEEQYSPEEIFSESELSLWAINHGFVKKENKDGQNRD